MYISPTPFSISTGIHSLHSTYCPGGWVCASIPLVYISSTSSSIHLRRLHSGSRLASSPDLPYNIAFSRLPSNPTSQGSVLGPPAVPKTDETEQNRTKQSKSDYRKEDRPAGPTSQPRLPVSHHGWPCQHLVTCVMFQRSQTTNHLDEKSSIYFHGLHSASISIYLPPPNGPKSSNLFLSLILVIEGVPE